MQIDPVKNTKSATVFLHQNSTLFHEPTLEVTFKKPEKLPVVSPLLSRRYGRLKIQFSM
jgi:hypothetical protein